MKHTHQTKKYLLPIFLGIGILILGGCTKEKAEAIKNAAEQFRISAIEALQEMRTLFRESLSMPVESDEKRIEAIAKDLENTTPIRANELAFILKDPVIGAAAQKQGEAEFDKIAAHYNEFAAMFRSLPQGSFFGKKAVGKAERHSINLTVELINFAKYLEKNPVQFTGRRVLLLENIQKDKNVADAQTRAALLERDAKLALELQRDELQAKQKAIVACLKAAENCRAVAELIRNYDSLTTSEILSLSRDALVFAGEISGGNPDTKALLDKFDGIKTTITNDPYWSALLDKTVTH